MMGRIEVNGIEIYAYHGCLPEESIIGGKYIVDLWIEADLKRSEASDKLDDTIDYVWLTAIVLSEMAKPSKLIEQVARRILDSVRSGDSRVEHAWVKVRKLTPPINANVSEVAVILSY